MVDIANAPRAHDEDEECPICEEAAYVLLEGSEKVCGNCFHAPTSETQRTISPDTQWDSWHEHRRQYSGFYGHDRVRMAGGFRSAWNFGEDGYL